MISSPLAAQTDTTFTYQGSLDDQGAAANGSFNLTFALFNALSGGAQVGSTIVMNGVPVSDGLLTAELDFGTSAFDNTGRWLEIAVDGNTLSPRQPITRSPYSIQTRGIVVDENNNVGIGTSTPGAPLHVESDSTTSIYAANTASSGITYGVHGQSQSTSGTGVFGWASASTGTTHGGFFQSDGTTARGVFGWASSFTGTTYGGRFHSNSTSGHGVLGWATANTGTTYGGRFESDSTSGRGVYAEASARSGTSYGGYFLSSSTSGRGVYAEASASTGTTTSVWGANRSTTGRAVFGQASATSGVNYGVFGTTGSTSGRGVFGEAPSTGINYGVYGRSNSSSGFDFFAGGAGTNYGASSSRRWKNNIEPISDPLAKLAQLRGVYYDWDEEHGGFHDVGMIAEEVGEVLPEIVQYEENGVDAIGMDYSKMTPLLVEAVNALRSEKDNQLASLRTEKDDEISELRETHSTEINDLREQLSDLRQIVEQLASNQEKESR